MRAFSSEHVPKPRSAPQVDWTAVVDRFSDRLDLEIGCGVGMHAIQYSIANPDRMLFAVERTREKFEKFQRRMVSHRKKHPLENLIAVHADAIAWITHMLPDSLRFQRLFLLYPNPEPKNQQRRWPNMPFFNFLLKNRMAEEHEIVFATNIGAYAKEVQSYCLSLNHYREEHELVNVEDAPGFQARTHFEKKYLDRGDRLFLSKYSQVAY